ncbi:SRPBCC family protein [Nocardioides sp. CPCC 205120]|uniref:SRPBCC family protein n=1 Tax=Nocardioides sp. CPCC 205120 TaxID=3406462 RepID=UPI003B510398
MTDIEVRTLVDAPAAVVFDLELDVDVHAASLAGSEERATTSSGSRRLGLGDEVTFRARHLGLVWTLTSRVTALDRPHRFVDEQVRGPFRAMRHEHEFHERGAGRTEMVDRMTFTAPLGPVGAVVARAVLAPYLRRLLRQRAAYVQQVAERSARGG